MGCRTQQLPSIMDGAVLPDPEEIDESDVSDDDESVEYSPGQQDS